jgi:membrane protease YdiL (CAAX protease family)
MQKAHRQLLGEVFAAFALIAAFLWIGRRAFPGVNALFGGTLVVLLLYSHRRRDEGLREIGFRLDTFGRALRLLLLPALIGATLIVVTSALLNGVERPSPVAALDRTAQFVVLGVLQQYLLLGFFYARIGELSESRGATVITALVFAILHLPNVFLVGVTLLAGVVSCLIYRKAPNLWANGLVHGLLACLLYYSLPRSLTGGLRVGIEYLRLATS